MSESEEKLGGTVLVSPPVWIGPATKPPRRGIVWLLGVMLGTVSVWALWKIYRAWPSTLPERWTLQVAVFVAVATVPHVAVDLLARLVVWLGRDLQPGDHVVGFRNPGAFIGMFERPLFLGALVGGYPQFIAVWFVFKGIAGYRVGLPETRARRTFQLFLLNNAVSLAGVGLGWLLWLLLGLPTLRH